MTKHLRVKVPIDSIGYIIGNKNRNLNRIMDNNMNNISILLVKTNPLKPYFEIKGNYYEDIIIVVKDIMNLCISFKNKQKVKHKGIEKNYIPKRRISLKSTKEKDIRIDNNDLEFQEYRPYTPDYSPPDL